MVELKKVKIRKKEYKFELKHKYEYVGHYKKIERPPIEKIKDSIRSLINPPKQEKKVEKKVITKPPKGGFNFAVFGSAILIALIILAIGWIYLTTQFLPTGEVGFETAVDKPEAWNTLLDGSVLSSGERGSPLYTGAVFVDYETDNIDNYTISLTPYDTKIPSEVFILNSNRIEATTYGDFISTLRSNLSKRKILLNEITLQELETLPEGAIVIIPSGVIPKEIMGFDSQITPDKLAERGMVIVYIGQPFTRVMNGSLVVSTPQQAVLSLPMVFDQQTSLTSTENFSLFQPLYRVTGKGRWESKLVYGSVSAVTKDNGAFIFIPQTLDGGWRSNPQLAATDIARIIIESPWAEESADSKVYDIAGENANGTRYFFTNTYEDPNVTVKVEFTGISAASKTPVKETLLINLEKPHNNELFIEKGTKVVPTNITQDRARLNAILKEPEAAQPDMFLIIRDVNSSDVTTFPQGTVNVQADRSFDIPIYVPKGEYVITLMDDESHVYAQSYMKVVSIDITWEGNSRAKPSIYLFDVSMDESPVTLQEVTVVVNNGDYGTYTFSNVDSINVDVGARTGDQPLPIGNYTFTFTSGALTVDVPVSHAARQTIFTDPLFWLVMILTGGVIGLGVIFARQESVYYSLDVPPFQTVTRTKVALSPDVILSIFQKTNDNYHWENTPLTSSEIKNGFKSIFVKGKPIFITDYNVEYLLDELEKKGSVGGALGYYGLTDWEKKSGRSMDYLVLMRRLRDICVNNAVPFTSLDESKEADSVITVVGQQMYVHFFDKQGDVKTMFNRVLHSIGKGITIILFKNDYEKEQFISLLDSSPSVAPLLLKMESDSKSLLFQNTEELEEMIKEFKSV